VVPEGNISFLCIFVFEFFHRMQGLWFWCLVWSLITCRSHGLITLKEFDPSKATCDQTVNLPAGAIDSDCSFFNAGEQCLEEMYFEEFSRGNLILSFKDDGIRSTKQCTGDYIFPLLAEELMWPTPLRIFMYLSLLIWCFLGVAIISDHFMAAIEVITSKEKVIILLNDDGEPEEHKVLVWNETVANLTLMALGSSAPEILISIVETIGSLEKESIEDGLGPSTIVGSAAFNLLCISAVCVIALENGEKRVIENYAVFVVTAIFSVFAYVWMYWVLSDAIVTIFEAFVTFMLFPALVGCAYGQSKNWWGAFGGKDKTRVKPEGHVIALDNGNHTKLSDRRRFSKDICEPVSMDGGQNESRVITYEEREKQRIADMIKAMPRGMSDADFARALADDLMHEKTSALRYRIDARRKLAGGRGLISRKLEFLRRQTRRFSQHTPSELDRVGFGTVDLKGSSGSMSMTAPNLADDLEKQRIAEEGVNNQQTFPRVSFTAYAFSVSEGAGQIDLPVVRSGTEEELSMVSVIYYETRSGTARGGEDFMHAEGKLVFLPGEKEKFMTVKIIDDNVYEENETFQVLLSVKGDDHNVDFKHSGFTTAEITIIDDDVPGIFSFEKAAIIVRESDGSAKVVVQREHGSTGKVKLQYKTRDSSAKAGKDYHEAAGTLIFEDGVVKSEIEIALIDDKTYEKDVAFAVEFEIVGYPECGADYGEHRIISITITNDDGYKASVDRIASMIKIHLENAEVGTGSWSEQLREALAVQGEDGEEPSLIDCILHILSFGWKVLFVAVPPTSYFGGKLTFIVSLLFIGVLTAVVSDVAKMFGCLLGISNSLTAITFVALGTSLPDTFASKTAAENDETADNSIGNITGSNSVNVFLGLGLPWLIASIYKHVRGEQFRVEPGDLSFSVVVFACIAAIYFSIMYLRRRAGFGELGGPERPKWLSFFAFITLWSVYILFSALNSKGIVTF